MTRYLLTGAGGFVGSHVLRHILTNDPDAHVVCPVTFTHRGKSDRIRLALDDLDAGHRVTVIRCDLTAPISTVTDHAFGHIDRVLNVASESHVDRSIDEPADFILNNVALMCRVLDWCRIRQAEGRGPAVIVQVSTDEVYGPAAPGVYHQEWVDLHKPSNPYAASKACQEDIAFSYWRTYDLPIVLTNTMNIIGETQDSEKYLPMIIKRVLAGETVQIHASPDGVSGSRFYLHARNQADGLLHVADYVLNPPDEYEWNAVAQGESLRYSDGGTAPYRFNIVGEREVSNLELAQMVAAVVGKPLVHELLSFHESRPGHDLRYALDGTKVAATGWKAPVPLEESLERTVRWTLDHDEWLY